MNEEQELSEALARIISSFLHRKQSEEQLLKANEEFFKVSKYSENELLGRNHRMINSDLHTKEFWVDMWKTISGGDVWRN